MTKKSIILMIVGIGLALLLFGVLIGIGVYYYAFNVIGFEDENKNTNSALNTNVLIEVNENENVNVNANTNANSNINTNTATEVPESAELEEMDDLELTDPEGFIYETAYYKVGTISESKYTGNDLILASVVPDGPSFYPEYFRFAKDGDDLTLLSQHSDDPQYSLDDSKFFIDTETVLADFNFPETLNGPEDRQTLALDTYVNVFFDDTGLKKAFTSDWGDVYTTDDSGTAEGIFASDGFFIEVADGTTEAYALEYDFFSDNDVPDVTWDDGTKNSTTYTYSDVSGCGATNFAAVVHDDSVSLDDLEQVGTSSEGDMIYGFKDDNHALLKDFYENNYYVSSDEEKVAYEEFVQTYPLVYWIDVFDRLVKAQSNEYVPPVECAKPVIYLYPEKKTKIDVEVNPTGGMAVSDPAYNDGWNVIAGPDGHVYDLNTKKNYPYLFWEGRSKTIYKQPEIGFVVPQAEVNKFLKEKLSKHGLLEGEIHDFVEFWEPHMQGAPYYFVTFIGNKEMDRLAPLNIKPKPDTVIRVLMDFKPLNEYIEVKGYEIETPNRQGFTVVEWGGVRR